MSAERDALEHFINEMLRVAPALDGMVPVAAVWLPVRTVTATGAIEVDPGGQVAVMWPDGFPFETRPEIMASIVRHYQSGAVTRQ